MMRCACGGALYRHGRASCKGNLPHGERYRCALCRKSVTVRNGERSTLRGRPMKADWRREGRA